MRRILLSTIIFSVFAATNSCYYDNMESLYPPPLNNTCDTTNLTYTSKIQPFINTYCLDCHTKARAANAKDINLEDYANVVKNADRSLKAINWDPGVSPMPQNASFKLDNCLITQFQIWIKNGKPEK